jgi:hypothetical protein
VRDLRFGPWRPAGSAFFYGLRFRVDGEWTSLHVLEQQDIVARFQEPLVHAALNCASRGCPPVQWFDSLNLQAQLREAMRAYVRSDVGMRRTETGWAVSEIFHWYRDDFLDWSEAPTLCAWLAPYADGEAEGWLAAQGEACPLEVLPYDWSLNQHTATPGRVLPARQATPPGKARRPLQRKDREAASAGRDSGD